MKKIILASLFLLLVLLPAAALGEFVDFSQAYPDKFLPEGSEPVVTENSYQSDDVNMTISTRRVSNSDVFVVDIYVRSVECFQRYHAGDKYGKTTAKVPKMAQNNGAIVAMTGDSGHYFTKGWAISNGVVNRSSANRLRDLGILYRSGEMVTVANENVDNDQIRADVEADKIWHIFIFGPALLDAEGKARPQADFKDCNVRYTNPRSVIGYYEPGHYCVVQVDGRKTKSKLEAKKKNQGIEMTALAQLMEELGCKAAYNLDGGQSSMLWYNGSLLSTPYKGGRNVGDIVMIKDLPNDAPAIEAAPVQ